MGLAQIFTVSQAVGGVSHETISSISLYFSTISQTNGVDIHIREVANGVPTYNVVKNSRVTVRPTDRYANNNTVMTASTNGTLATPFRFLKPVQLKSLQQYALMIMPHTSDPFYVLWGAAANDIDQTTKVPVAFNAAVGPLMTWDPGSNRTIIPNQAIKFLINKC